MTHTSNIIQLPKALIYSADSIAIIPLREYLSHFGCQVFVNIRLVSEPEYFFIVGTSEFVTDILEKSSHLSCKILGIIWSYETIKIQNRLNKNCKLAVVAPDVWNQKTIADLMRFFITSNEQFFGIGLKNSPPVSFDKHEEIKITHNKNVPSPTKNTQFRSPLSYSNLSTHNDQRLQKTLSFHTYRKPSDDVQRISQTIASIYAEKPNQDKAFHFPTVSSLGMLFATFFFIFLCYLLPYAFLAYRITNLTRCIKTSNTSCVNQESMVLSRVVPWVKRYDTYVSSSIAFLFPTVKLPTTPFVSGAVLATDILSLLPDMKQNANTLYSAIVSGDTQVPVLSLSQKLLRQTHDVSQHVQDIQTKLTEVESLSFFPFTHILFLQTKTIREHLSSLMSTLTQSEQLLSIYPVIGGFRNPTTYGVVFQNAEELRPTGGLLLTILTITMDGGVVSAKKIEEIADLDKKLRGHVDPPGPIQHILGQEHWYFQDSNWDPDFPTTAEKILWFYNKETGLSLDGVIAITTNTVRDFLTYIDPVAIQAVNAILTSENFHEQIMMQQSKTNVMNDSSNNRSILHSIIETLLSSVSENKTNTQRALAQPFLRSLATGETAMYFSSDTAQQMVRLYGWDREVPKQQNCLGVSQEQFGCESFLLHMNEANLSPSSMPFSITRSQSRELIVDETGIVHEYDTKTLINTKTDGEGTPYTTYLQFVYGQQRVVESVTINGKTITEGQPSNLSLFPYWETVQQQKRVIVGVAAKIPPGDSATITVATKTQIPLRFKSQGVFLEITTQRQAGIPTIPTSTIIRYPRQWGMSAPEDIFPNSLAIQGQLEYNNDLSQDETMYLILKKTHDTLQHSNN